MSAMQWAVPSAFPAVYEELNVSGFFTTFAELLLDRAAPQPGERLLDVATGTGIVLRRARARCPDLASAVGLDLTAGMLAVAREKSAGLDIDYVEGDATALPFPDGSFDLVTCQQGLQFFPQREQALVEFGRVLDGGGRLVVACWADLASAPGHQAFVDALASRLPDLEGAARNPFSLANADDLRRLVEGAGFVDVTVEHVTADARFDSAAEFARSYMAGSPLAIPLAEVSDEDRAALAGDITDRIKAVAGEPVVVPMATNIATAHRR
jgi:SAM-dependent methyltransferase